MATITYTDSTGNHLWSDPLNWDAQGIQTVPTANDDVFIGNGTIIIDSPNAICNNITITGPGNTTIEDSTVHNGTLTLANSKPKPINPKYVWPSTPKIKKNRFQMLEI